MRMEYGRDVPIGLPKNRISAALPKLSGLEVIKALQRLGFENRRTKGSHVIMRNYGGNTAVVPLHKEITTGTLASIIKHAGIDRSDLRSALR